MMNSVWLKPSLLSAKFGHQASETVDRGAFLLEATFECIVPHEPDTSGMKSSTFAMLLACAVLGGCGRRDETERAARSQDENVPNGPFVLGFWPGEPRKFALEKAQAL